MGSMNSKHFYDAKLGMMAGPGSSTNPNEPTLIAIGTTESDSSPSSMVTSRGLYLHSMMYGLNVFSEIR